MCAFLRDNYAVTHPSSRKFLATPLNDDDDDDNDADGHIPVTVVTRVEKAVCPTLTGRPVESRVVSKTTVG